MEQPRPQSAAEELVNAVTHGIGAVLGLAGLFATVGFAASTGWSPFAALAVAAYTLSVFALFGVSAAYHATTSPRWKAILQKGDHCAIYGLIAGTYTPFTLVGLGGTGGWVLFAIVWTLALVGIALELAVEERWERVSLTLYLLMGWLGLFAAVPLVQALPTVVTALVLLGGLLYTGGVWFYSRNRPWDHAVWHGFVLGGALSHGAAVALCVT